ncbi:MAG: hypothetical protein RI560_06705 [Natronomonas sp.]|jgi:hypothetical protein|uniref:Uncharacterized protein n=1 Tax=Natronomonas salsuginis TaxID=2217661 RepID=A0A4U5JHP8_9EURY|nr:MULTISPECIES: hypothetical protein [Natronomonas]MDR9381346.1 hypothetical protein [Natronomonas sp.]MDR9429823.1 hypothetical protein [Natronomonas sp.]TKR27841.1 hypothetical protein DM868_01775 [Natronomonas salsuginis]
MTDDSQTLEEISHTNPYTGQVFGETQTYGRGKVVAADGGKADSSDESETLADVPHTTAEGTDGVQRTFDRGESE